MVRPFWPLPTEFINNSERCFRYFIPLIVPHLHPPYNRDMEMLLENTHILTHAATNFVLTFQAPLLAFLSSLLGVVMVLFGLSRLKTKGQFKKVCSKLNKAESKHYLDSIIQNQMSAKSYSLGQSPYPLQSFYRNNKNSPQQQFSSLIEEKKRLKQELIIVKNKLVQKEKIIDNISKSPQRNLVHEFEKKLG